MLAPRDNRSKRRKLDRFDLASSIFTHDLRTYRVRARAHARIMRNLEWDSRHREIARIDAAAISNRCAHNDRDAHYGRRDGAGLRDGVIRSGRL